MLAALEAEEQPAWLSAMPDWGWDANVRHGHHLWWAVESIKVFKQGGDFMLRASFRMIHLAAECPTD